MMIAGDELQKFLFFCVPVAQKQTENIAHAHESRQEIRLLKKLYMNNYHAVVV